MVDNKDSSEIKVPMVDPIVDPEPAKMDPKSVKVDPERAKEEPPQPMDVDQDSFKDEEEPVEVEKETYVEDEESIEEEEESIEDDEKRIQDGPQTIVVVPPNARPTENSADLGDFPILRSFRQPAAQPEKKFNPFSVMGFATMFAAANATITGLAFLICIGTFIYCALSVVVELRSRVASQGQSYNQDAERMLDYYHIAVCAGSLILVELSSLTLLFAVVLLNGIMNRKPQLVRYYVIYGVVLTLVGGLCASSYTFLTNGRSHFPYVATVIIFIFVYIVVLYFLRLAYLDMESGVVAQVRDNPNLNIPCVERDEVCGRY